MSERIDDSIEEPVEFIDYTEAESLFELVDLPFDSKKYGRRTICTPELIQEIAVRIARDGCSYKDAALLSGIGVPTFQKWMKRGRTEEERLRKLGIEDDNRTFADETELPFLEFFQTINKAVPLRKSLLVSRIREAGKDSRNWTANAWLLERMHPDEFGRKTRLDIKQIDWRDEIVQLIKQGIEFNIVANKIGEDETRELFERAGVEVPGIGASGPSED